MNYDSQYKGLFFPLNRDVIVLLSVDNLTCSRKKQIKEVFILFYYYYYFYIYPKSFLFYLNVK